MKHNNFDKFIAELESIKMTSSEKHTMRTDLASFAVSYTPVKSPYRSMMIIAQRSFALAFVAIFSLASFSNAATKNSLPGDVFYPVKIAHEEIALATTFGSTKKITYEIRRTEKRIQEATVLVQKNNLDTEAQIAVSENIKKQASKVKQHIKEVKQNNPEEALILNAELKSTVKVSQEALRKVSNETNNNPVIDNSQMQEVEPSVLTNNETVSLPNLQESAAVARIVLPTTEKPSSFVNTEIKITFAQSLLESLDQEVQDIEAFEDIVEDQITENEKVVLPESKSVDTNVTAENEASFTTEKAQGDNPVETKNEKPQIDTLVKEIKSLQDIVVIKKSINSIKKDTLAMHIHRSIDENGDEKVIFDEAELRQQADVLISEKKYKQAFVIFQKILEHYKDDVVMTSMKTADSDISPSERPIEDKEAFQKNVSKKPSLSSSLILKEL